MGEETLACLAADARDVEQLGVTVAHRAAFAMIADGEAMTFIADHLDQVKDGRMAVEDDGFVFVAVEVDDFFFFGDGGEGLRCEAEGFEGVGGGVELAEASVDQDEGGHGGGFFAGFSLRG